MVLWASKTAIEKQKQKIIVAIKKRAAMKKASGPRFLGRIRWTWRNNATGRTPLFYCDFSLVITIFIKKEAL